MFPAPLPRLGVLAVLGVACAAPAAAAEAEAPQGVLEITRSSVRSTAEWLARGVDSWFGDQPFEDGGKVTNGRLSLGLQTRQGEKPDFNLRFNARFRLPNVERQTYLFIGRDDEREVIADTPGAFSRQERLLGDTPADRSFFAGIGLTLRESVDFRLGFRGGLKPYAQIRYRQPWQLDAANLVEFRETLFWTIDDHLGSTTALSYEHAYSSTLAARWLNAVTVTQRETDAEWSTSLGLFKDLARQRLVSLEGLASGKQGTGVAVSDVGLQVRWQQPVHKDWLLGELVVGHFWPREDAQSERRRAWALGGRLKMAF